MHRHKIIGGTGNTAQILHGPEPGFRSVQTDITRSCQQHARAPRQAQQRPTQRSIFARAADHGPYICRSKSSYIAIKRNIIMFAAK